MDGHPVHDCYPGQIRCAHIDQFGDVLGVSVDGGAVHDRPTYGVGRIPLVEACGVADVEQGAGVRVADVWIEDIAWGRPHSAASVG